MLTISQIVNLPSSPTSATRLKDEWVSTQRKQGAICWWYKRNENWKILHPELSWKRFCREVLGITYQYSNDLAKMFERIISLPEELAPTERESRVLNQIPQEAHQEVMRAYLEQQPRNHTGEPVRDSTQLLRTWEQMQGVAVEEPQPSQAYIVTRADNGVVLTSGTGSEPEAKRAARRASRLIQAEVLLWRRPVVIAA